MNISEWIGGDTVIGAVAALAGMVSMQVSAALSDRRTRRYKLQDRDFDQAQRDKRIALQPYQAWDRAIRAALAADRYWVDPVEPGDLPEPELSDAEHRRSRFEIDCLEELYTALQHLIRVSDYMPTVLELRPSREELRALLVELHDNRPPASSTAQGPG